VQKGIDTNSLFLSLPLNSLIPLVSVLFTLRILGIEILSLTASVQLQCTRRHQFCGNGCGCRFAEAAAVCREEMGRLRNTGLMAHKTQSIRVEVYDQRYVNSAAIA